MERLNRLAYDIEITVKPSEKVAPAISGAQSWHVPYCFIPYCLRASEEAPKDEEVDLGKPIEVESGYVLKCIYQGEFIG